MENEKTGNLGNKIPYFPYIIFHFPVFILSGPRLQIPRVSVDPGLTKWKMKNEKWKMIYKKGSAPAQFCYLPFPR